MPATVETTGRTATRVDSATGSRSTARASRRARRRRAPRARRSTEGAFLRVLEIIGAGAGIPPEMSNATSWSMAVSFVLLFGYVLACVVAVWFVAWVDRKLSSRRLFREIYRELGIGRHPPR
jgi:protein-S-isoprenylcysteine O-methyltransferase Ste14